LNDPLCNLSFVEDAASERIILFFKELTQSPACKARADS
jgi:hypothetical protein